MGLAVPLRAKVGELPLADQQLLEIGWTRPTIELPRERLSEQHLSVAMNAGFVPQTPSAAVELPLHRG